MIDVRSLTKRFGPTVAVNDVSFEVERGEVIGLLGPNGAGKTTTMRILTGFMPADEGTATLAGHEVHREPLEVRRKIGYLPESAPLYLDMKVFEYLEYIAAVRGIPARERLPRMRRVVELTGLEEMVNREIAELSRGYRQRVGLAQTLIHEPQILILDEPTSGLDPNQIVEIRDLIKEMGRERTVILSTHILSEVEATCGRVIIIDRGRVVAAGQPAELSQRARSGAYWQVVVRAPEEAATERLASLPGVSGVTADGAGDGLIRLRLDGDDDPGLGEAIFARVVESGWSLAELRREQATLEHVFRELTARDDDPAESEAPADESAS